MILQTVWVDANLRPRVQININSPMHNLITHEDLFKYFKWMVVKKKQITIANRRAGTNKEIR